MDHSNSDSGSVDQSPSSIPTLNELQDALIDELFYCSRSGELSSFLELLPPSRNDPVLSSPFFKPFEASLSQIPTNHPFFTTSFSLFLSSLKDKQQNTGLLFYSKYFFFKKNLFL